MQKTEVYTIIQIQIIMNQIGRDDKIDYSHHIISGLKDLHKNELIHRDLHIRNLLHTGINVKITDMYGIM